MNYIKLNLESEKCWNKKRGSYNFFSIIQFSMKIYDYVIDNYKKKDEYDSFDIYIN